MVGGLFHSTYSGGTGLMAGTAFGRIPGAHAAGYEVTLRTALALKPAAARFRGWHLTGVSGPARRRGPRASS
jgi:hypothetical protein